jgi:transposase-like protein
MAPEAAHRTETDRHNLSLYRLSGSIEVSFLAVSFLPATPALTPEKQQQKQKTLRGVRVPGHPLRFRPGTWLTPWRRTVGFPSFGFTHEDAFMPWKETRTVDQRLQFLSSYQKEEMSVTDLCHEYGISRPTAYKWIKRYDEVGPEGLLDLTRTPHSSPHANIGRDRERSPRAAKAVPVLGSEEA